MGKTYKPSLYNFFIPEGGSGGMLLFNGLNSALIRLPQRIYPIARAVLSSGKINVSVLPSVARRLFALLKEGGFLINDDIDEPGIIKKRFLRIKKSGHLHLIIAPTLDCNLACKYCYQFRSPGIMPAEVCDRIVEFAAKKLKKGNIRDIRVDWYGGEPLMAQKVISYLSGHFLKLAGKFKCGYEASIATNGTLLNYRAVNMLIRNKVNSCQVTIDGTKKTHDKRRGYKNNKGSSFDRILGNMKLVAGKIDLSVRINVDADNITHAAALLDFFERQGFFRSGDKGFLPYLAIAGPINPNIHFKCRPVNIGDFYGHNLEFQKRALKYSRRKHPAPLLDFPSPVNASCGALRENSYAFDPRGYYFKCGLEIGEPGKECGNASGAKLKQCKKWDEYSPFDDKKCVKCRYLPFCMGNCPKTEFDGNSFYGRDGCVYWKGNLENIVNLYVNAMESR